MTVRIIQGDCRERLRELDDESVHCVVTSPPYFGLRDYGVAGQIGLETSLVGYVDELVAVFREVRRVLRPDGTVWLNLGDSYAGSRAAGNPTAETSTLEGGQGSQVASMVRRTRGADEVGGSARDAAMTNVGRHVNGLKQKDLVGAPWMVAFALRADGWWLRQDIIWQKPNPLPESVVDRCTKAHEYVFMLSKSARYYFDAAAIAEPVSRASIDRVSQATFDDQRGGDKDYGASGVNGNRSMRRTIENFAAKVKRSGNKERKAATERGCPADGVAGSVPWEGVTRNKRSVWTVPTVPFGDSHFATFPPALVEPCILAGCPRGGTVLDPFLGAGTTALVADRLGRNCVGVELNPEYVAMARRRIHGDAGMFADVEVRA